MGAGVKMRTVRGAAWPGTALAAPSSRDAVEPWCTLEQDTQPHSSLGRLLVPSELNSPAAEGPEGARGQAAAMEVLVSIGEPGREMQPAGMSHRCPAPSTHAHWMGRAGAGCPGIPEMMAARAEPNLSLHEAGGKPHNIQRPRPSSTATDGSAPGTVPESPQSGRASPWGTRGQLGHGDDVPCPAPGQPIRGSPVPSAQPWPSSPPRSSGTGSCSGCTSPLSPVRFCSCPQRPCRPPAGWPAGSRG